MPDGSLTFPCPPLCPPLCSARWVAGIKHNAQGEVDYNEDFFGKKAYLTVSGQLQVSAFGGFGPGGLYGLGARRHNSPSPASCR